MYFKNAKRIVIKLGSSTIVDKNNNFKSQWLKSLIADIKKLRKENKDIVIVSSGAIALGKKNLKIKTTKLQVEMGQALAAIGQIHLVKEFQKTFLKERINVGQILITQEDTEIRRRSLNARRAFENLFKLKTIPIVNENDTTATTEIKYGDNDRLAARVAQIINAELLINLSNVDGLYSANKKSIVKEVKTIDQEIESVINKSKSHYGSGGMATKIEAAKICMKSGCYMVIANGELSNPIANIIKTNNCTWFIPSTSKLHAKEKWIAGSLKSAGKLEIDDGAAAALKHGKSLLPAGIVSVLGNFNKGDNILILNNGMELAQALSSFSSEEINKVKGKQSNEIEKILGYPSKSEIVHKNDMVILKK